MSLAVTVALPAVLSVTLKVFVPEVRVEFAGKAALLSDDVIPTLSLTVLTTFQLASTALTVTLKAVPAVSAVGVPVFPLELPGEAVSPGTSSCSLANPPGLIVMAELVLLVMPPCVESDAVTVWLPAALSVTLKTLTPLVNPVLDGKVAFASLDVIATVSFVLIKFQLASMALTVTVKATAAVWAVGVPILPVVVPGALVWPGASTCS